VIDTKLRNGVSNFYSKLDTFTKILRVIERLAPAVDTFCTRYLTMLTVLSAVQYHGPSMLIVLSAVQYHGPDVLWQVIG